MPRARDRSQLRVGPVTTPAFPPPHQPDDQPQQGQPQCGSGDRPRCPPDVGQRASSAPHSGESGAAPSPRKLSAAIPRAACGTRGPGCGAAPVRGRWQHVPSRGPAPASDDQAEQHQDGHAGLQHRDVLGEHGLQRGAAQPWDREGALHRDCAAQEPHLRQRHLRHRHREGPARHRGCDDTPRRPPPSSSCGPSSRPAWRPRRWSGSGRATPPAGTPIASVGTRGSPGRRWTVPSR